MAISDHVPLAKAGSTKRNVVVALLYFILLPVVIGLFPFYLLFAIGTNRNGLGDAVANSPLGSIPGVGGGGWSSAVVVFAVTLVAFGAIGAVMPAEDTTNSPEPETTSTGDDVDSGSTDTSDDSTDSTDDTSTDETDTSGDGGGGSDGTTDSSGDSSTDDSSGETTEPQLTTLDKLGENAGSYDDNVQSFSGSGDSVETLELSGSSLHAFSFEHDGDANFIVQLRNADGETEEYLVNEIGTIEGTTAAPLEAGEYQLQVQADGNWKIDVIEPSTATEDVQEAPAEVEGSGHTVVGPIGVDGSITVSATHDGDSNFIVHSVLEDGTSMYDRELLINEQGDYEGEVIAVEEGVRWITISADGNWTLEIE